MRSPSPACASAAAWAEARQSSQTVRPEVAGYRGQGASNEASGSDHASRRAQRRAWAQLIRRIYELDPLVCEECGAAMKVISFITEAGVVDSILRHLDERGRSTGRDPPKEDASAPF